MNCKKRTYETWTDANDVLNTIRQYPDYHTKAKREERVYRCPFCDKYHLTSITEKERRKYKERVQKYRAIRIASAVNYWSWKLGLKHEL